MSHATGRHNDVTTLLIQHSQYAILLTGRDEGTPSTGGKTAGYAILLDTFEVINTPKSKKGCSSHGKMAGAAAGCLVLGAAISGALFAVVRRRRASRWARAMTPPEWRGSCDSATDEKERLRVAMIETNA